jgi:hypothetical protein
MTPGRSSADHSPIKAAERGAHGKKPRLSPKLDDKSPFAEDIAISTSRL